MAKIKMGMKRLVFFFNDAFQTMCAATVDFDYHNVELAVEFLNRNQLMTLTSDQGKIHMMRMGSRTKSTNTGLFRVVQLVEEVGIFIPQSKHSDVIKALSQRGIYTVRSNYPAIDGDPGYNPEALPELT